MQNPRQLSQMSFFVVIARPREKDLRNRLR
jgi:hypothetical protein